MSNSRLARLASTIQVAYLRFEEGLALLGAGLIVAMMLVTTIDVAIRQLRAPLLGAFEVMEFMMAGVVFLGLAYVQRIKGHVAIEFLASRFNPRIRSALRVMGHLAVLVAFTAITWQTGQLAYAAWEGGHHTTGGARFPTWPGRIAVPIGTGLLCVRVMIDLVTDLMGLARTQHDRES